MVALVGNLATEPAIAQTETTGQKVCTFRLAVARHGTEEADFFTIVTFDRQAEVCAEYLAVGRRVAIEGRLHHSSYEVDLPNGEKERRSKVEVIGHRVEMLGRARRV